MIRARRLPDITPPAVVTDSGILEAYLEDASAAAPGRAAGLVRPASEAEAAAILRDGRFRSAKIIAQAARSSLTGGAIPQGELILSVERMRDTGPVHRSPGVARRTVGPGIRLCDLQEDLAGQRLYYPPVPTYQEAMLGGTVATNAGGAATFKYGVTRQWIRGLRVLLANGDLIEIERGEVLARRGEIFTILLSDGRELSVPVPDHRLPDLKKISAGYHAADPLDLVDLFVGSEGTLGLITAITIDLLPLPAAVATALVFLPDTARALRLTAALRDAALRARSGEDRAEPDVRAIEWLDGNALEILRRHGAGRRRRVGLPDAAGAALLVEVEFDRPVGDREVQDRLEAFLEGRPGLPDGPLVRFFRILRDLDAIEHCELAFPEDERRHRDLKEIREAVPRLVNETLTRRRGQDAGVRKAGGDLIVPFEHLAGMIAFCEAAFDNRGLEHATWGHLSDGNLHPNALSRDSDEAGRAVDALMRIGDEATRLGGCPLSEHGVGRSPLKQELLRRFLGDRAISRMREIKRAIDPELRFAPGVIFPSVPD